MFRNVFRASMLDIDFYRRAEEDAGLTLQSAVVVLVATGLGGIGSAIARESSVVAAVFGGMVAGVVGWLVWALLSYVVGTKIFSGTADYAEMLRVLGFAFAPFAIGIVPWLGFPAAVWVLFASLVAVREGLDLDLGRTLATVAIGWLVWLGSTVLLNVILDIELNAHWPFP
ncbi:MAG: YIP1 family protein [Acidimicrobiia bacterium]|nr:YIP1 family protein [Acidimicrobiia bacterium]